MKNPQKSVQNPYKIDKNPSLDPFGPFSTPSRAQVGPRSLPENGSVTFFRLFSLYEIRGIENYEKMMKKRYQNEDAKKSKNRCQKGAQKLSFFMNIGPLAVEGSIVRTSWHVFGRIEKTSFFRCRSGGRKSRPKSTPGRPRVDFIAAIVVQVPQFGQEGPRGRLARAD